MEWFSVLLNGITVAGHGVLILSFSGGFTGKKLKIYHFIIFLTLFSFTTLFSAALFNSGGLDTAAELLLLYGANRLLGSSRLIACTTTILAVHVVWLSCGIVNSLACLLFPSLLGNVFMDLFIILALLIAFALSFGCYELILKYFPLQAVQREPFAWLLLTPCLFALAVELYLAYIVQVGVAAEPFRMETGKYGGMLLIQLLGLGSLLCTLYAYQRTCDGFLARSSLSSLAQEAHAQRTYVAEAQLRYERTKAFRHDLKNHLSVLDGLLKTGNLPQAQLYLQKLDVTAGELSFPVHTGNPVLDILLGEKLELAKQQGIRADISLALPQPCSVDDFDLCVIFSNALDNAIRACGQIHGPGAIRISGVRQGDFFMLEFENTCPDTSACFRQETIGTGLSNIKTAAEKYYGAISIEKKPGIFLLNVLLNISILPDGISGHNA